MLNPRPWPAVKPPRPVGLDEALADRQSVIVLVVGSGADLDQTERRCRILALDPGFEAVRVVRVEDPEALAGALPVTWLSERRRVAVVGPDRRVAFQLERPDAIDLFVAVAAVA